ncbi:MAG: DNA-formamidopyrimidine glycosylase [Chloroflexi bacterium]|nr:DNA-formamidopyrimidine glycosylase [Chloroflexota bacterium]
MPELPEVETFARQLRAPLVGRTITGVAIKWPRHVATPSPREFAERIRGQRIETVTRRGKYLVLELSGDALLIHLKMSGDLTVVPAGSARDKHAHTIFHLNDGNEFRFSDTRKFGRVYLVCQPEEVTGKLGPEPLAAEFTAKELGQRLAAHSRALKPLLLDQTFLAGVGNIYADEALHMAGLHPLRKSDALRADEVKRLWRSIRRALNSGIRHNGASIDWVYRGGDFQNHFRVYGRQGEPCPACGTRIRRITVSQRGTHFCPHCQRKR